MNKKKLLIQKLANSNIFKNFQAATKGKNKMLEFLYSMGGGDDIVNLGLKGAPLAEKAGIKELKKMLQEVGKSKAKTTLPKNIPSVTDAALSELDKAPGVVAPQAAMGAAMGAGAGMIPDTDTETTNILGATTSKPGTIGDRLEYMLAGGLAGAGLGAAGKLRSIGSNKVKQMADVAAKSRNAFGNIGSKNIDELLSVAKETLTPAQIDQIRRKAFEAGGKYYGTGFGELEAQARKLLQEGVDVAGAPKVKNYGVLEKAVSDIGENAMGSRLGGAFSGPAHNAKRMATAIAEESPTAAKLLGLHAGAGTEEILAAIEKLPSVANKISPAEANSIRTRLLMDKELQGFLSSPSSRWGDTIKSTLMGGLAGGGAGAGVGGLALGPIGAGLGGLAGGVGGAYSALKNRTPALHRFMAQLKNSGMDPQDIEAIIQRLQSGRGGELGAKILS